MDDEITVIQHKKMGISSTKILEHIERRFSKYNKGENRMWEELFLKLADEKWKHSVNWA